ncbi:MAG: efflux RND transporter permease subunit [Planctomycetaceae bacterium]|nr:efflux RND transporter permease subunit [Planctomycetaceae bacterium]
MFILPCHLGHDDGPVTRIIKWLSLPMKPFLWCIGKANQAATWCMQSTIHKIYLPSLRYALRFPFVPISIGTGILAVSFVLVSKGITPFILFPKIDSPMINAQVVFSDGTPVEVTDAATREMENAIVKLLKEVSPDEKIFKVIHRAVGHTTGTAPPGPQGRVNGSFVGVVDVELVDSSLRSIDSSTLINRWREMSPTYPDAESLIFTDAGGPGGPGAKQIEFKLLADAKYMDDLEKAAEECVAFLRAKPGVFDLDADTYMGKEEFRFQIKEDAKVMGITSAQLADAVRGAYYGEEVMRLQRGRHEVKLMVRYPQEERRSLLNLSDIRVRGNDRAERPITEVAEIEKVREYSELNRVNQLRSITIAGDVDFSKKVTANLIFNGDVNDGKPSFNEFFEDTIKKKYPSVFLMYEGQAQQQAEALNSMITGFIVAMLVIFLVLTLQFKSYIQPFIIMAIMPFALIGVIWGHYFLTIPITLFSLCGIVALMGVVINDSIVLVDFINKSYERGGDIVEVLMEAGRHRFRPVALTSITTVAGLFPILTETSLQATLLIPMAASLCFGLAVGTVMIMYLVPVFYRIYIWAGDFFQKEMLGMETVSDPPTMANADRQTQTTT